MEYDVFILEIGDEDASLRKSEEIPCTELTSAQIQVTSLQENATGLPKCEVKLFRHRMSVN